MGRATPEVSQGTSERDQDTYVEEGRNEVDAERCEHCRYQCSYVARYEDLDCIRARFAFQRLRYILNRL